MKYNYTDFNSWLSSPYTCGVDVNEDDRALFLTKLKLLYLQSKEQEIIAKTFEDDLK